MSIFKNKADKVGLTKITTRWTEYQVTFTGVNLDAGDHYDVQYKSLSKVSGGTKLLRCDTQTQVWETVVFVLKTHVDDKIPCSISLRKLQETGKFAVLWKQTVDFVSATSSKATEREAKGEIDVNLRGTEQYLPHLTVYVKSAMTKYKNDYDGHYYTYNATKSEFELAKEETSASSDSSTESQEEGEKEVPAKRYSLTKSIKSLGPKKELVRSEQSPRRSDTSSEENDGVQSSKKSSLSFSGLFGFGKSDAHDESSEEKKSGKSIRKSISSSEEEPKSRLFGVGSIEDDENFALVNSFVNLCLEWLKSHRVFEDTESQGLFRKAGDDGDIRWLKQNLEQAVGQGQPMTIPDAEDMHVVASLFKRYFREMKVPLIPFSFYTPLLQLAHLLPEGPTNVTAPKTLMIINEMAKIMKTFPKNHYQLLGRLCLFAVHHSVRHDEDGCEESCHCVCAEYHEARE